MIITGFIEDARNERCSDKEIEKLFDVFTKSIGYFSSDVDEKSWGDLRDFFKLEKSDICNFSLKIHRGKKGGIFHYVGEFKSDSKNLKIFAKSDN